jgi:fibronectin type 3 domain-containing protein
VRLSWDGAAGAATYRIYRSESPDGGFLVIEDTSDLVWEDIGQGGNANSYYYRIRGVNACGVEGP